MNLLNETMKILKKYGKVPQDVEWVGAEKYGWFSWEEFKEIADIEYDNGYGGQEIVSDLVVVGEDWWLERAEYDGSEWWEYKTFPNKPGRHRIPDRLRMGLWERLTKSIRSNTEAL